MRERDRVVELFSLVAKTPPLLILTDEQIEELGRNLWKSWQARCSTIVATWIVDKLVREMKSIACKVDINQKSSSVVRSYRNKR
jgi:hypothetical protein